jgi:hypothetical protein
MLTPKPDDRERRAVMGRPGAHASRYTLRAIRQASQSTRAPLTIRRV